MTKLSLRLASAEDIERYYGERPTNRVRAWVAEMDGEIVGVAGLEYETGHVVMFADIAPPLRPHKKWILKESKQIVEWAKAKGVRVMAVKNPAEPNASRFLEHLGFTPVDDEFYILEAD